MVPVTGSRPMDVDGRTILRFIRIHVIESAAEDEDKYTLTEVLKTLSR